MSSQPGTEGTPHRRGLARLLDQCLRIERTCSHVCNVLGADFKNNIVTRSEQVGIALIRNCKRRSSHRPSASISHHTLDNRKREDKRSSASFFRPEVCTAG